MDASSTAAATAPQPKLRAAFGEPRFAAFLAAQALSSFSGAAFMAFLVLLAATREAPLPSASIVAAGAAFVLPFLLFSTAAGDAIDRRPKSRLFVVFKAAEPPLLLAAAGALGSGSVPALLAVLFLMGAHSAVFYPLKLAILPELVVDADLSAANGLMQMTGFGAVVLGLEAAATALRFHAGPARAVAALAGIGLFGILAALFSPDTAAALPPERAPFDIPSRNAENLRELAALPFVNLATYAFAFFWFVGALFQMNLLNYGTRLMGLDPAFCARLPAILAFGLALGSYLAGKMSRGRVEQGLVPLGGIGLVVFSLDLGFAHGSAQRAGLDLLMAGVSGGFYAVPLAAYIQQRAPAERRGRIIATGNFLSFAAIAIAATALWVLDVEFRLDPAQVFLVIAAMSAVVAYDLLRRLPDFFLRLLLYPIANFLYDVRAVGRDNVPAEGPVLLVSNHVSYIDGALIMMANQRLVRFLMLRHYYELPLVNWLFRAMGAIPVSSGDGPKALAESFRRAREYMLTGQAVCVFAEGGITRHGQMQKFKKGFERMVEGVQVPIVPVHLDEVWGSVFSFSEGRAFFKWPKSIPYRVTVSFGKPLPATATAFEVRQAILELAAAAFARRLADSPPLPLLFARESKRCLLRGGAADSSGTNLNGLSTLVGAHLLGVELERRLVGEERVGLLLPPSVPAALANFGLSLRGKIPINLNYTATKEIVDACLAKAEVRTVVTSRKVLEKLGWTPAGRVICLEDVAPSITPLKKALTAAAFLAAPYALLERTAFRKARGPLDRVATIMFTSGSTGVPKGVMLTHANVLANIVALKQVIPLGPTDRILGVLPFFHVFGFMGTLWLPACLGMGMVYHFTPLDARVIGSLAEKFQATFLLGTPTFLLAWMRRIEPEQLKSLRFVVVGAERLREEVAKAFQAKYGLFPLEGYGATELSPVASINIPDIDWPHNKQVGTKAGTVGRALPGVFMKAVDPDTGAELGPDEPGLLLVKGPNVMKGYLGDDSEMRAVLRDGYYVTGDIGKIDEDGFVTLTDRLSRFAKVGGEMVPLVKVEENLHEALGQLDQTLMVASVPDDRRGERLVVLYKDGVDVDALRKKILESGMPKLWIPDKANFHKVSEFPLLGSGKADFQKLKAEARRLEGIP
ncbi:MAG: MFS transporter [Elusimicrobiota bacterium]